MRIKGINDHPACILASLQAFQKLIQNISAAESIPSMHMARAEAAGFLNALNSTQYITSREHYEYQRSLRSAVEQRREEITHDR